MFLDSTMCNLMWRSRISWGRVSSLCQWWKFVLVLLFLDYRPWISARMLDMPERDASGNAVPWHTFRFCPCLLDISLNLEPHLMRQQRLCKMTSRTRIWGVLPFKFRWELWEVSTWMQCMICVQHISHPSVQTIYSRDCGALSRGCRRGMSSIPIAPTFWWAILVLPSKFSVPWMGIFEKYIDSKMLRTCHRSLRPTWYA